MSTNPGARQIGRVIAILFGTAVLGFATGVLAGGGRQESSRHSVPVESGGIVIADEDYANGEAGAKTGTLTPIGTPVRAQSQPESPRQPAVSPPRPSTEVFKATLSWGMDGNGDDDRKNGRHEADDDRDDDKDDREDKQKEDKKKEDDD